MIQAFLYLHLLFVAVLVGTWAGSFFVEPYSYAVAFVVSGLVWVVLRKAWGQQK
jgi:hypothetical protein